MKLNPKLLSTREFQYAFGVEGDFPIYTRQDLVFGGNLHRMAEENGLSYAFSDLEEGWSGWTHNTQGQTQESRIKLIYDRSPRKFTVSSKGKEAADAAAEALGRFHGFRPKDLSKEPAGDLEPLVEEAA